MLKKYLGESIQVFPRKSIASLLEEPDYRVVAITKVFEKGVTEGDDLYGVFDRSARPQ